MNVCIEDVYCTVFPDRGNVRIKGLRLVGDVIDWHAIKICVLEEGFCIVRSNARLEAAR